MANIKETMQIIENTPCDQPIMLKAIHGVGKSECVRDYFTAKGYRVVTLFLGQMSDAGDVLGLLTRKELTLPNGQTHTVADFCAPKWWPFDEKEKVILHLDELNRAKPEMLNVVMDLVLNRELAGRKLPSACHVIASINPIECEMYQVEEMDAALLDRFNQVDFRPSVDEWVDWACKHKIDNKIIAFISKNNDHLDPPTGKEYKPGHVYPSRRSWARVGTIVQKNPGLMDKHIEFSTLLLGVVGERSTAAFMKHLRENTQISVGVLLTDYKKVQEKIKNSCQIQDIITINREVCLWMETNEKMILDKDATSMPNKVANNLCNYLDDIPAEGMAEFISQMSKKRVDGQKWPQAVMTLCPELGKRMVAILSGAVRKKD